MEREKRGSLACRGMQAANVLLPVALGCCCDAMCNKRPKRLAKNTQRLRRGLERLGPAFVKLGQVLASREDVFSEEVTKELQKLCDQVPPFPYDDAARVVSEDLALSASWLPREPVAAASLGQVYQITVGGQQFAMKVQRPGLARSIARDVVLLRMLAWALQRALKGRTKAELDMVRVVSNWAGTMWDELDYLHEAGSMDTMRRALAPRVAGLVIPEVHWDLTSTRVLTTQWVQGTRLTESVASVTNHHIALGVEAFASMMVDLGLLHADPHAGNLLVVSDTQLCLLDFGMTIEIPEAHRLAWAQTFVSMVRLDHNATLDGLIKIGFFPEGCPREELLPVMSRIWSELVACGSSIKKRKEALRRSFEEIKELALRIKYDLPDYYVCLGRALLTLEGIALAANCEFDIFEAAFPVALRAVTKAAKAGAKEAVKSRISAVKEAASRPGPKLVVAAAVALLGTAYMAARA